MACDVKTLYTFNNATIFPAVTDAVAAALIFPVQLMSASTERSDKHIDTSRALWHKRGLDSNWSSSLSHMFPS